MRSSMEARSLTGFYHIDTDTGLPKGIDTHVNYKQVSERSEF